MDYPNHITNHEKGKHLTYEDYVIIELRLKDGWKPNAIAKKELHCAANTVRNIIKKGMTPLYNGKVLRFKAKTAWKAYAKRGTPMVQITFEADTSEFLLSNFDDWHIVLNNCYLADNEQGWDDFYANNGDQRTDEIIASWDKLFNLSRYTPDWDTEPSRRTIQATLWEVHISQVKKVEHFIAR